MPELDHIIMATPDVPEGVRAIADLTGVEALPGGPHVGLGTHNFLLTFDAATYFEIIGPDPDQPAPGRPLPFGIDALTGPKLAGYAIHPTGDETLEDVQALMRAAGFEPGEIIEMSRRKPDGDLLTWRLTTGGDTGPASQGALPFAIDWCGQPSPAASLPSLGQLRSLRVAHPDAAIRASVEALQLGIVVEDADPALTATVETANGSEVEIR